MSRYLIPLVFAFFTTLPTQVVNAQNLPQLHQAVVSGDFAKVKSLVAAGADINQLDPLMGNAPVHIAAQTDHTEILKFLLDNGAFINLQTPRAGHSPLMVAAWYSKADNIKLLFSYPELNIELKTPTGAKAEQMVGGWDRRVEAHEAALYQKLKALFDQKRVEQQTLLAKQEILNTVENNSLSDKIKAEKIAKLIAQGHNVNQRRPVYSSGNDWHTPLLVAARQGNKQVVKVLLEHGADQTIPGYPMNAIAFHKAGYMGHPEIVKLLVNDAMAAQVLDAQGPNNGYTPLHDAIWHGNTDAAEIFIENGALLHLKTYEGDTPLALAKRYQYKGIVELLTQQ